VVLVNFWATWCNTCVVEMASMERLVQQERGKKFRLLAVSVDDNWDAVRKFFAKGTPLDVLLDTGRDVPKKWGTEQFPESFLVDKDGTIRYYIVSNRDWSAPSVSACIDALLD
jgi:thiol-disulfide isomerase/thioredoxin